MAQLRAFGDCKGDGEAIAARGKAPSTGPRKGVQSAAAARRTALLASLESRAAPGSTRIQPFTVAEAKARGPTTQLRADGRPQPRGFAIRPSPAFLPIGPEPHTAARALSLVAARPTAPRPSPVVVLIVVQPRLVSTSTACSTSPARPRTASRRTRSSRASALAPPSRPRPRSNAR